MKNKNLKTMGVGGLKFSVTPHPLVQNRPFRSLELAPGSKDQLCENQQIKKKYAIFTKKWVVSCGGFTTHVG